MAGSQYTLIRWCMGVLATPNVRKKLMYSTDTLRRCERKWAKVKRDTTWVAYLVLWLLASGILYEQRNNEWQVRIIRGEPHFRKTKPCLKQTNSEHFYGLADHQLVAAFRNDRETSVHRINWSHREPITQTHVHLFCLKHIPLFKSEYSTCSQPNGMRHSPLCG